MADGDEKNVVGLMLYYYDYDVLDPLCDELALALVSDSDEEYTALVQTLGEMITVYAKTIGSVVGFRTELQDELMPRYDFHGDAEKLGEHGDYTYYVRWVDPETVRNTENADMLDACYACAESFVESIELIDVSFEADTPAEDAQAVTGLCFETTDLNGNTVDQSILANARLTILNVWATTCAPCISEMPELERWSHELPEGVQLISLLSDVTSPSDRGYGMAQRIIEKGGITYPVLLSNDDFAELLSGVMGTPTTFFLDSNGNSVQEPVVGAYVDQYKEAVERFLSR